MYFRAGKFLGAATFYAAFYLAVLAVGISAQIQFDTASSGAAFSNLGVSSLTWQHTVTEDGINRALFVGISTTTDPVTPSLPICTAQPLLCTSNPLLPSASARVASVTYNGDMMLPVGFRVSPDLKQAVEIYRLVAPDEGQHDVVVTLNPASVFQVVGGSNSFENVSQVVPNGAFVSANGTDAMPILTVGDALSGDIVLDALAIPPNALNAVVGGMQIERYNGRVFFNNTYDIGAGSTESGTAAATETMSWLTTNPSNWALAAISIKQSNPTAAAVTVSGRVLNFSGRGVSRARVTITDSNGVTRSAITNFFGYFRFEEVTAGETYIFNVSAKLYSFSPQIVTVNENITELNFIARH
jgi:hypothetical protein